MKRTTFKLLGLASAGVGIVGAFLPILPSTVFFIIAVGFFARSSPELETRVLNHPVFGPPVVAWREHGAIPTRAKLFALGGMAFGYLMFFLSVEPGFWLGAGVAAFMLASAAYVASRPAGPDDLG